VVDVRLEAGLRWLASSRDDRTSRDLLSAAEIEG
jgi:hypothetical protein